MSEVDKYGSAKGSFNISSSQIVSARIISEFLKQLDLSNLKHPGNGQGMHFPSSRSRAYAATLNRTLDQNHNESVTNRSQEMLLFENHLYFVTETGDNVAGSALHMARLINVLKGGLTLVGLIGNFLVIYTLARKSYQSRFESRVFMHQAN